MRWSSRRARRQRDIHPDTSPEVLELARIAEQQAPRLLQGQDPDRVGLALFRPRASDPRPHDAFVRVLTREELEELGRAVNLSIRHRPGWFTALFVTPKQKALGFLASEERIRFEESAS
jgi:hypothetical protein